MVATYAPMKRELKGPAIMSNLFCSRCSNLCPDEKGTERLAKLIPCLARESSNLCPDEKGTESLLISQDSYKPR